MGKGSPFPSLPSEDSMSARASREGAVPLADCVGAVALRVAEHSRGDVSFAEAGDRDDRRLALRR